MQGIKLAMHNLEISNQRLKQQNVHFEKQVTNLRNTSNNIVAGKVWKFKVLSRTMIMKNQKNW